MRRTFSPLRLLAALWWSASALPATPLITEFLASNSNGLQDEDGERPDWIEIHNPDPVDLHFGGYRLTDDPANPFNWTVPPGVFIPARGYIVIFASGKNRSFPGSVLHTDFKLNADGEFLGLYDPGGVPLSSYSASIGHLRDVSYGLTSPEPNANPGYFTIPTPGTANTVSFSLRSRTFNQGSKLRDAPLTVALSFNTPGATIRYTTNGAVPVGAPGITVNFTADPITDVLTTTVPHGLSERDEVQFATDGMLPGGLGAGLNYYVYQPTPTTLKLLTAEGLQFLDGPPAGLPAPVDITSSGTGVPHSIRHHAATFTTNASGVLTTSNHTFRDRDEVEVIRNGTAFLPFPLAEGIPYYVIWPAPGLPVAPWWEQRNKFQLSATPGGQALAISQSGASHTVRRRTSPAYTLPLPVNYSMRLRARAFEQGRQVSPVGSESYLMLDAAAQSFTSSLPIMILHSWGSGHPSTTVPMGTNPEDTKDAVWFVFEPKSPPGDPDNPNKLARMTNVPDLVTPAYFERRGSSSFGAQKYSMSMGAWDESREGKIVAPLGFSSNDDFVLNAPFGLDRSLVHNDLMYRLSNEIGRYAPRTRHVEIFTSVNNDVAASGMIPAYGFVTGAVTGNVNDDYYGVYSFQDKVSRGRNRVDIEKLTPLDNTAPESHGGYLIKIDTPDPGEPGLLAGGRDASSPFVLVQPKEFTSYPSHLPVLTGAQRTYLTGVLDAMFASCTAPDFMHPLTGYQAHLDVPAAIDNHILNVAPKNVEAFRRGSFWHKSRYGKLVMGPIFDFDLAMGSTDPAGRDLDPLTWGHSSGTDYFHDAPGTYSPNYFHGMFQDPNFWQAWIDRYHELRTGVLSTAHIHALIDAYTELLDPGNAQDTPAKRNFTRFPGVQPRAGNVPPGTDGTFRGEMQWLKNWWTSRLDFMDGQFTRPATSNPVDGPVAPGTQVTLSSPSLSTPGVKIFFTTNGADPRPASTVAGTVTVATLLPEISTVRAIVSRSPTSGLAPATAWRGADTNANNNNADDFDDSAWFTNAAGTINGVGYDDVPAINYLPFVSIRWNSTTLAVAPANYTNTMRTTGAVPGNQSCYIRWAFNLTAADLTNLVAPNKLVLQVRYDDGFASWLNGTLLTSARPNSATAGPPPNDYTHASAATTIHDDTASTFYSDFEITAFMGSLHEGTNLLAIQGLNFGLGSSDFVIQPKLVVRGPPPYAQAVSPDAVEYSSQITINAPTQLFVRTLNPVRPGDPPIQNGGGTGYFPIGSSWSAPTRLYFFPGAVSATQSTIRITEVHYHPYPPTAAEIAMGWTNSNDFEFIRLTNIGTEPVDLTGIHFSNGLDFTVAPGLQNLLPPGESVVVVENIAAFTSRYGASFRILGEFRGELDDGGEHIVLNAKTGEVISDFSYDDNYPWPGMADAGYSLLYVSGDQNLPASWCGSPEPGGTTGVTTYDRWLRRYFTEAEIPFQPMSQDDDGDGLINFGEYIFATDPRVPGSGEHAMASIAPAVAQADGDRPPGLMLRRRACATDVTWIFETASTLPDWTPSNSPPELIAEYGNGTEAVIWRPAAPPGTRLFMRVRATSR